MGAEPPSAPLPVDDVLPALAPEVAGLQEAPGARGSLLSRVATRVMAVGLLAGSVLTGVVGCGVAAHADPLASATTLSSTASTSQQRCDLPASPLALPGGAGSVFMARGADFAHAPLAQFLGEHPEGMARPPLAGQDSIYQQLQQHTLAPAAGARTYPAITVQKGDYVSHRVNYSTLISNEEFTDANAMNAEQLQKFFDSTGSFLGSYTQDGKTAAQIIDQAAKAHHINPRVILATLEKENSLVSRTSEPAKWVMRSAMGYAYDDGGGSAGRHSNFAYQVDKGTRLLHDLFEEGRQVHFPAKMVVDYGTRKLRVNNAATWSLMRYTPHTRDTRLHQLGGGNYNFHHIMQRIDRQIDA